jgi:glycopeptide antibiotics resistance protein
MITQVILVQKIISVGCIMFITVIFIMIWIFISILSLVFDHERYLSKMMLRLVLTVYILSVLYLTLLNRSMNADMLYNLKLFWSYQDMMRVPGYFYYKVIVLNILLFVPFGFLPAFLIKRFNSIKIIVLLAFLFSSYIELSQLLFRRGLFELDDLFNNSLGALIGYGIFYSFHGLFTNKIDKITRFILGLLPCLTVSSFFIVIYFIKK